jgi:transcriptional regulator with XRE-family HTH domain
MKDAGLNQRDLAQRLGMAQASVSNWLKGEMPNRGSLYRLSEIFRVTPQWLGAGQEPMRLAQIINEPEVIKEAAPGTEPTRGKCVEYLERFLETCDTTDKLGWTYIELIERFPLDKWTGRIPAAASSTSTYEVGSALVKEAERRYSAERERQGWRPSPGTDGTSGKTDGPSSGTSRPSTGPPPSSPKKAPK